MLQQLLTNPDVQTGVALGVFGLCMLATLVIVVLAIHARLSPGAAARAIAEAEAFDAEVDRERRRLQAQGLSPRQITAAHARATDLERRTGPRSWPRPDAWDRQSSVSRGPR